MPGDTFKIKTSKIARMQTLKTPMMDDVFLDTYYFFVPNRLVWTHWRNFMGEDDPNGWIQNPQYSIPKISAPTNGWNVGTVADYLGIRPGVEVTVNALPFRAYALICNEWFRDENLMDPLVIELGDSTVTGVNTDTYTTDVAKGGKPFIACKTHDYFTSALVKPQKGPDVGIPTLQSSYLPVVTLEEPNKYYKAAQTVGKAYYQGRIRESAPMYLADYSALWNDSASKARPEVLAHNTTTNSSTESTDKYTGYKDAEFAYQFKYAPTSGGTATNSDFTGQSLQAIQSGISNAGNSSFRPVVPINLAAALNDFASMTSINELRRAFQIQRFYEKEARGGTRYIELIKVMFGITSPDARMMRPEYLGGNRLPLNVRQITQTSSTTENQPLGDVAGMSVTTDNHFDFEKSFTEHGYIIGCCVARYHHTYQQGIDRTFTRSSRFDYYWPTFAHIGEQAVKNIEIYAQGTTADSEVFGYQEAWADYRYKPNKVSGMMRSDSNTGLDTWHLADDYSSLPALSASWIREDKANLDRVLQVTSTTANQIFADIYVENKTTRPMPLYSIPGLIDHF